ncbi:unnamed protein product [Adineta steineri]|uniref:XPG N-terminal domain-containing protein n=1 Tax=Adineta steineri TaxID=433720 RepID=A0A819S8M6_9BILA|nr:unnamed protein product [Adineta steineri]CAF4057519.1 unnamed protein product [Adineta steineri]
MGIRGLQKFIEETFEQFVEIKLRDCDIVLDGDSIYHQMYDRCKLICVFGGEYDQFYQCCMDLFESFKKWNINALVVFDGAQLDDRKRLTHVNRANGSVEESMKKSDKLSISPLLLRQTFISVLDAMQIPYVSPLGENDEECVSLANHFNCYLMATDSDYFCYNLHRGYIPFEKVIRIPPENQEIAYLTAQLYHIDSLLKKFEGLRLGTLALACCLCGNDYIDSSLTERIIRYMNDNVDPRRKLHSGKHWKIKNLWNAMEWMRNTNGIDEALDDLLTKVPFDSSNELKIKIEKAFICYLEPSDTLIYRFSTSNNANLNLKKNPVFVQLAQSYLSTLDMNDNQLKDFISEISQNIKSKCNHSLPLFLADAVTDLRLPTTFIDILIHRELIRKALIEVKDKLSVFSYAIPIILPCFASLLKWDQELNNSSIIIHRRKADKLAEYKYFINNHDPDIPELEQIWTTMPIDKRQDYRLNHLK